MRLLNYTSLLFLAPLAEAWRIQHTLVMRYGMVALAVMSQVNHSTYHPVARGVDIAVAHFMVLYALWLAALCEVWSWKVLLMVGSVAYSATSFWILKLSRDSDFFHAIIHVATSTGSYCFISEPVCIPSHANDTCPLVDA
eukprot:jgi/Mesvir1/23308/Mv21004-RA.1